MTHPKIRSSRNGNGPAPPTGRPPRSAPACRSDASPPPPPPTRRSPGSTMRWCNNRRSQGTCRVLSPWVHRHFRLPWISSWARCYRDCPPIPSQACWEARTGPWCLGGCSSAPQPWQRCPTPPLLATGSEAEAGSTILTVSGWTVWRGQARRTV